MTQSRDINRSAGASKTDRGGAFSGMNQGSASRNYSQRGSMSRSGGTAVEAVAVEVAEAAEAVAEAGDNHDYFTIVFRQKLHGGENDVFLYKEREYKTGSIFSRLQPWWHFSVFLWLPAPLPRQSKRNLNLLPMQCRLW